MYMAQFGGLNLSGGLAGFSLTEERGDGVNRRSGPERTVEIPVIDDAQLNEMTKLPPLNLPSLL
jgi:hypothetical protein